MTQAWLDEFHRLCEIPASLARLRDLMRELAVRGNLSSEDGGFNETANVLLERLRTQRAHTQKQRRRRKENGRAAPSEPSFDLPPSWAWASFTDVADIASNLVKPDDFPTHPHVAPDNIEKSTGRLLAYRTVAEDGVRSSKHRFFPGQILYSKIRPNLSKAVIVDFEGLCSADMYPLTPKIDRAYLHLYILSPVFLEQVVLSDNRLAMPKVNQQQLSSVVVALPPLAEQKRIVAKVDELLALCDELETRQQKKAQVSVQLNKAALHAVVEAPDTETFRKSWKRIEDNFELLYDRIENVEELRRAILDFAVQGRLSIQNAEDEPAMKHTERIRVQREALVQSGVLRKQKARKAPPTPASLPTGWCTAHLADLFAHVTDGDHQPPPRCEKGVPFLVISNIRWGSLNFEDVRQVPETYYASLDWSRQPLRGDLLYTVVGSFGIPVQVDTDESFCVQRHIAILKATEETYGPYWRYALASPTVFAAAEAMATGTAQKTVPLQGLRRIVVPVPPLPEQRRIVEQLDALMALCDDLEAKLKKADEDGERLMQAVVESLVA